MQVGGSQITSRAGRMSESPTQQNRPSKFKGGELLPGTVIDQRLEIVRRLSRGVKESVYLCRQLVAPHQTVVLKLVPRGRSGEDADTTYARFQREIVALYSISHPHVVNVYEAINEGEVFGYTMEYVAGGNLDSMLEEGGELTYEHVVQVLTQVCDGLQAIHDAGIIHRALKPKNILLDQEGNVKITDFAVAKVEGQKNLTSHGTVIGTMDYVSPEYITRGVLDIRLDIYSIGVIAYEMVTGTTPFHSEDFIETLSRRASMDPEPPIRLNPSCPRGLSDIVMKAIHRDPEHRYQSAFEMLEDLENVSLESTEDSDSYQEEDPLHPQVDSYEEDEEGQEYAADDDTEQQDLAADPLFGADWEAEPRRGSPLLAIVCWVFSALLGFGIGWGALLVLGYLK